MTVIVYRPEYLPWDVLVQPCARTRQVSVQLASIAACYNVLCSERKRQTLCVAAGSPDAAKCNGGRYRFRKKRPAWAGERRRISSLLAGWLRRETDNARKNDGVHQTTRYCGLSRGCPRVVWSSSTTAADGAVRPGNFRDVRVGGRGDEVRDENSRALCFSAPSAVYSAHWTNRRHLRPRRRRHRRKEDPMRRQTAGDRRPAPIFFRGISVVTATTTRVQGRLYRLDRPETRVCTGSYPRKTLSTRSRFGFELKLWTYLRFFRLN